MPNTNAEIQVKYRGESARLHQLSLASVLPNTGDYITYEGRFVSHDTGGDDDGDGDGDDDGDDDDNGADDDGDDDDGDEDDGGDDV